MNILNRIDEISLGDLHRLQSAILEEIQRRKAVSAAAIDADEGPIIAGRITAATKAAPAKAKPAAKRRAA